MPHLARISSLSSLAHLSRRMTAVTVLGFALALSGASLSVPEAEAQGVRKGEASSKSKRKAAASTAVRTGPLVVNVSLSRQRLTVYDATRRIATAPVSSGRRGRATPTGVFSIVQKRRHHISNIYNVSMPNMQRLTWSGIALHAGALPGYPASSGCIRLPSGFSRELFGMTRMGTRVIVTRDPVAPVEIVHERLFAAYPPADAVAERPADEAPTQVADAAQATGATSDTVSSVLGVTSAHAAEMPEVSLSPARKRFLERRAAAAGERADALRTAGYAWSSARAALGAAEREAEAARAALAEVGPGREAYLDEVEQAVAWAHGEISRLAASEPADAETKKTRSKGKPMSEAERAARIAELRLEIEDAELEIAPLRARVQEMRARRAAAEARANAAERTLKDAKRAAAEAKTALDAAQAAEEAAKKQAATRDLPVSVFVSRERQRLYVRQGYQDIFDVEVAFKRPDEPIGTHVFTALDYAPEVGGMTWSVVSVPYDPSRGASRKKTGAAPSGSLKAQTAAAALERFDIPEDAREAIADVMKPGSSMVISDFRLSNETGKYTDLIATIR